ncbi:MAG: pro-sigmaK processing inhibitor BofA family protein [Defluviitaleaceae bacterium]|nr:pro-sigmaK processing inhibitor BofA family protein [Defluviitaleaceae bacterium]
MDSIMWLMLALAAGFIAYLLYTRQFGWLVRVIRNMALGVAGMLVFNLMLVGFGLSVGINAITALVVGLLGAPGFMMLYAAQLMLG